MRKLTLFLLILIPLFAGASVLSDTNDFIQVQDDLGLRVYLKEKLKTPLSLNEWLGVRKALAIRPNAGFDLVFAWDRHKLVKGLNLDKTNVDKALVEADQLMSEKKFGDAFKKYQIIARTVKNSGKGRIKLQNRQFYFSMLQAMGRSLYGAGRYAESLEVYSWIPAYYFQIRQVLFEKMWAAFRASKFDQVIGAIASQQSGYFSYYLDPESYLIKIYVMKRLCREQDIKLTLASIEEYLTGLKTGKITAQDWARRDLILSGIDMLAQQKPTEKELLQIVSFSKRDAEQKRLSTFLQKNFEKNRVRLISQLQKVLGYAKLALGNESSYLAQISDLPDSDTLSQRGLELWPATEGEEWLDEIGSHVYIGDSQCVAKK